MEAKTIVCQNCKADFVIAPDDFGFYEKIKVPLPTFCPDCRRQRRWAWRNNMSLYSRECDMCKKSMLSIYSPDSGLTIYCNKCWWSDKWDPKSYGREYDFSRPFFTQMAELAKEVPHMAIVNDDGIASLNCEYTHDWWFSKNCYMCLSGWYVDNVLYSFFIIAGKDIMDSMNIRSKNEWLYECNIVANSYRFKYGNYAIACIDCQFVKYAGNCQDCFMCVNIKDKKYFFKNKQYSKEDYEKILQSYRLDTYSGLEKAKKEFQEFLVENQTHRYAHVLKSERCTGDVISYSKNCKDCYIVKKSENCRHCDYMSANKECYDLTMTGESSECYDSVTVDQSQANLFGIFSVKSQDVRYTQHCHASKDLFGCVGMKKGKHSILNREYTKEEYETLVPKIISHMNEMPYVDKQGNKYKYGEFFPTELSPFGYNETNAQEITPISKKEALMKGYKWQDNIQKTVGKETMAAEQIPDSINDVSDSILNEVLACIECKRNYKIVPNELIFYRKMGVPVARKCFFCRHNDRIKTRKPFKIWPRSCMCKQDNHTHEKGKCEAKFQTIYPPDSKEAIYCRKCYQAEVY